MAEPNRKTNPRQVFDVSKPNKSRPSNTAKPVIVTNRPILQDPMVNTASNDDEAAPTAPLAIKMPAKIKIQPLSSSAELTGNAETIEVKNLVEDSPGTNEPDLSSPIEEHLEKARAEAGGTTEAGVPDLPKDTPTLSADDTTSEADAGEPISVKTVATDTKAVAADEPKASEAPAAPVPAAAPASSDKADELPFKPSTAPRSDTPKDGAQVTDKDLADDEDELSETDIKIQKMVVEKRYFLPINTQEKRRTKRFMILGFFLIVLLAAAWADIALDAGLIQIDGVKPLTHLFSN